MPAPPIGYAEIPGEIDASQYDPAHFPPRFEQIPEEGAPLPARDSLMVDAPYAPIERPADEIPETPADHQPIQAPTAAESVQERTLFDRVAGLRIEPILGRLRPAAPARRARSRSPPAAPVAPSSKPAPQPESRGRRRQSVHARSLLPTRRRPPPRAASPSCRASRPRPRASAPPRPASASSTSRPANTSCRRSTSCRCPRASAPRPRSTRRRWSRTPACSRPCSTISACKGQIVKVRPGPVVTLYELEPAPGTKSSRVIGLADDIARSMSAVSARVATVPGRNVIGIELPNARRETVFLRELLSTRHYEDNRLGLPLALGKDIGGEPVIADLARMPHLLIAGTTGSGKSVAINTMILSLLYRLPPDQLPLHHDRSQDAGAQRLRGHPASADARRHRAAQGDRGAEMGGARDGGPLPRHELDSACATSRATTSGWRDARAQGRGADPPGADRLRSRDRQADLRGRGDRPRRRCPSSSSSSTRWPT